MARFHVYGNADGEGYLLDVQANLLEHLNTCVVVPLLPPDKAPKPASILNPVFEIERAPHVMVTQFMAAVPRRLMSADVLSLEHEAHVIVSALDCLFQGI
ncbi:MAG: CcdB family protein [Burkholderiaceae bacterium]